ncbi:PREDICTED: replication protein A 32 kDa subunit-like [Eufriesea mexicana]|uniref:replication protein A 32 kDa subunit-like n=1 Tax=Eufriesea mexicana TaxID=516756 RepID=UPI00083BDDF0|nr:PREDICTED: replication protein A 32 kDa subunit-like [Eufriesea mexicana]
MWGNDTSVENVSGGFLNDNYNSNEEYKGTAKRINSIIPVMIQHLTLGDIQNCILSFIGIVYFIEQSNTKIIYGIKDETGEITCLQWLKPEKTIINLNSYVRIYGHLRIQSDKKFIMILKIWSLTDLNELTNHLLEVICMTLKTQKMSNKQNDSLNTNNVLMRDDTSLSGLTKEQTLVFKVIQAENDSENGIERNALKARVPKIILSYVDDIIDFLTSEGHIYTTLTDDHFKTT